jgi:hypothetical protein
MVRSALLSLIAIGLLVAGCVSPPPDEVTNEPEELPVLDPVPVAWAEESAAVLRPGSPIGWCTYNFLWVDEDGEADDGVPTYYIGTAAHCVEDVDERLPLAGAGEIGSVAFTSFNETFQDEYGVDGAVDFALIRLDEGWNLKAHPRMMNKAGPTGYATAADVAMGDELQHHGYGMVFGDVEPLRDRPGYLVSFDRDYCSESVVWWGDSGSPVLHAATGKAIGIVSRAGWTACLPSSQLMGATIPYILDELAKTPFADVRLALDDGSLAPVSH